jgi:hypothetical protein
VTIDERIERLEHVTAMHIEQAKKRLRGKSSAMAGDEDRSGSPMESH